VIGTTFFMLSQFSVLFLEKNSSPVMVSFPVVLAEFHQHKFLSLEEVELYAWNVKCTMKVSSS